MRLFAIIAAAFLVGALPAPAQSNHPVATTIQDRSYKLLSEDEDWSFLTDTDLRQDLWDPIKYVRFRNDSNDRYLTIGGEAREVWEQIGNDNWRESPFWNGYFNERYMVHFDIHYGKYVRTFVELKSGLNSSDWRTASDRRKETRFPSRISRSENFSWCEVWHTPYWQTGTRVRLRVFD